MFEGSISRLVVSSIGSLGVLCPVPVIGVLQACLMTV